MMDFLEALVALAQSGTMAAAAAQLRITPSALSKRIANLESQIGYEVIEQDGRRVRLTPAGAKLVEKAEPLLAELRLVLKDRATESVGEISIGVSESVLMSWGAKLLTQIERRVPGLRLKIGSHRSPIVIQRVLAGEYALGLCAGTSGRVPELVVETIAEEPLVIVPSGLQKFEIRQKFSTRKPGVLEVMTIEPHAATWTTLQGQIRRLATETGIQIQSKGSLQSFGAVVQLAKAGYAHALAPVGVATALGVPRSKQVHLPRPGLIRPISLIGRPSTLSRTLVRQFVEALREAKIIDLHSKNSG